MQVYIELALAENFCMDFTLLYCAKVLSKNPAKNARIVAAAAFGAAFAVLFPLIKLAVPVKIAVKLLSMLIICLIAGKFNSFKAYFKLSALFCAFTFVLGGALIAIFSLSGISYAPAQGYILSSVPIGIPLFFALILFIIARKIAQKLKRTSRAALSCKIYKDGKCVSLPGFYDSGNRVYSSGRPVSVIPLTAALALVDASSLHAEVKVSTVAQTKKLKMFTADKLEVTCGGKITAHSGVQVAISPLSDRAILHPDLMED